MNLKLTAARATLALAALGAAVSVAGCGSPGGGQAAAADYYTPAGYDGNAVLDECYYDQYPGEVTYLEAAGLCPAGWRAYPAPLSWREEYYQWYSSSSYVTVYVPSARRASYRHAEVTFYRSNRVRIVTAEKTARYKDHATGKIITGSRLTGKTRFGPGTAVRHTTGTGAGRATSKARPVTPASRRPSKPKARRITSSLHRSRRH